MSALVTRFQRIFLLVDAFKVIFCARIDSTVSAILQFCEHPQNGRIFELVLAEVIRRTTMFFSISCLFPYSVLHASWDG
jgi:hypothetical protein